MTRQILRGPLIDGIGVCGLVQVPQSSENTWGEGGGVPTFARAGEGGWTSGEDSQFQIFISRTMACGAGP